MKVKQKNVLSADMLKMFGFEERPYGWANDELNAGFRDQPTFRAFMEHMIEIGQEKARKAIRKALDI